MKFNKIVISLLCLSIMMHTPTNTRYKSSPLKRVHRSMNLSTQESISFDYKILSSNDCKKYFNSKNIPKQGYQPILITFANNSKHNIFISPESFSLETIDPQDVANCLHRDGIMRGIGFWIGSWFFFPLIIPALAQGFGANKYNDDMDIDFANKSLKHQIVPPYTTVNGVIFVFKDQLNKDFTLIVQDKDNNKSFTLTQTTPQLTL